MPTFKSALLSAALGAAVLSTAALAAPPLSLQAAYPPLATAAQTRDRALGDWVEKHAQPLGDDDTGRAGLQALASRLAGSRVVGIGEATHGSHEDMALKAALIGQLVQAHGFRVVALEANRAVGERLQRFIAPGSTETDAAQALHESKIFEIYRCEAMVLLLRSLQAHNRQARALQDTVRVVGIDVQDPGRDAKAAFAAVAARDKAAAQAIQPLLAELLDENVPHVSSLFPAARREQWMRWMRGADALDTALRKQRAPAAASDATEAAYALKMALLTFEFDVGQANPAAELPLASFARRDAAMAERVLRVADRKHPVALWAHDMHVADNAYDLLGQAGRTTGGVLRERLGSAAYQSVNFSYRHAVFHARRTNAQGVLDRQGPMPEWSVDAGEGWLGMAIGPHGPAAFWLDLDQLPAFASWAAWFRAAPWRRGQYGFTLGTPEDDPDQDYPAPLSNGVYILIHLDTLTPSRMLGASGGQSN